MASTKMCECVLPFPPPCNLTPLCNESACVVRDKEEAAGVLGKVNVGACERVERIIK